MFFSSPNLPKLPETIPDSCSIEDFLFEEKYGRHPTADSPDLLVCGVSGRKLSISETINRVDLLARSLESRLGWASSRDTQRGKVVCSFAANAIDTLPLAWAIHRLLGIVTPANVASTVTELAQQLQATKAAAIFTSWELLDTARKACQQAGIPERNIFIIETPVFKPIAINKGFETIDDLYEAGKMLQPLSPISWESGQGAKRLAFLCYSSGTSGAPKAVMITHKNLIAGIMQVTNFIQLPGTAPREVCLCLLPQSHIYGLALASQSPMYRGAQIIVLPGFDVQRTVTAIQRFSVTTLFLVPTIIMTLFQSTDLLAKYNLSSIVDVYTGAAPMGPELLEKLHSLFPNWNILQGYGMTEAGPTVAMTPRNDIWIGSSGKLLPQVRCRLVDPRGSEVTKYKEPGELLVHSPSMVLGYLDNPEANQETFRDGWLHTGDVAYFDKSPQGEEHLFIVDRVKELIKVKSLQVSPTELEAHILLLDAVAECAVHAVDDAVAGELPRAVVVRSNTGRNLSDSALAQTIVNHVQEHKSRHKWLRGGVEFVDQLPKTASGKVSRRVLRDNARRQGKTTSTTPKL